MVDELYIGDGVTARWDGWSIELRTPRPGGDHIIYLEQSAMEALKLFAAQYFN